VWSVMGHPRSPSPVPQHPTLPSAVTSPTGLHLNPPSHLEGHPGHVSHVMMWCSCRSCPSPSPRGYCPIVSPFNSSPKRLSPPSVLFNPPVRSPSFTPLPHCSALSPHDAGLLSNFFLDPTVPPKGPWPPFLRRSARGSHVPPRCGRTLRWVPRCGVGSFHSMAQPLLLFAP